MSSIPVLHVNAVDNYSLGFQVGSTFKDRIKSYLTDFTDLSDRFLPFYSTKQGRQICDEYLSVATKYAGKYVDEVRGLADGSGISFTELFLMHLRTELQTFLSTEIVPECSSVFVNNSDHRILAHNEDTSEAVRGRGYLIDAKLSNSEHCIWAFCYPGTIPGNCFSCNSSGMFITLNALYPELLLRNKLPRQFVNRLCLDAKNISQLMEMITNSNFSITTGCSMNVVSLAADCQMLNLELRPSKEGSTAVDTLHIKEHYIHYNMYQHSDVKQLPGRTTSSEHRQKAANMLPPPTDMSSTLVILGNTDDQEYPIYRTPRKTDSGCTVATGCFDFVAKRVSVYVDNPAKSSAVIDMPLPCNLTTCK